MQVMGIAVPDAEREMDKQSFYEQKYRNESLRVPRHFIRQFTYLARHYGRTPNPLILDAGGGTGEYSLALQQAGYRTILLDFAAEAIRKARERGVHELIQADFMIHDFKGQRMDLVLAKGFSPLNTDDESRFAAGLARIRGILGPQGTGLYWTVTDLSGRWSASQWYQVPAAWLSRHFNEVLVFPAFRYQVILPLWLNRAVSRMLLRRRLPKSMTAIGIIRP
jgi:SAM-dependent methyltransferase